MNRPAVPPATFSPAIQQALREGRMLEAIRLLRSEGNMDLRQAKGALEAWLRTAASVPQPGGTQNAAKTVQAARNARAGMQPKHPETTIESLSSGNALDGLSPGQVSDTGNTLWLAALGIACLALLAAIWFG